MATTTGVIGIDVKCVIASNFPHIKYTDKDRRNLEWQSRLAINKINNYANHNDCVTIIITIVMRSSEYFSGN